MMGLPNGLFGWNPPDLERHRLPRSKPRIYWSGKLFAWICSMPASTYSGVIGIAGTPKDAYENWRKRGFL